jgi:hypothetical protein
VDLLEWKGWVRGHDQLVIGINNLDSTNLSLTGCFFLFDSYEFVWYFHGYSHEQTVCFLVLHVFVALSIWALKMNFDLKAYTRQSLVAYITTNLQQCALSFTLFWTLFYGLVYLF